ncbi:MAG: PilZ domain-containing protein [Nitrospiraceae bacterium]|nr:MAG: PilZ domain-containing protein [Nitrospiraceae bacterium]
MNRREFNRTPINLTLKFPVGTNTVSAVIKDISPKGVNIESGIQYSIRSKFELTISFEDELNVFGRVVRLIKTENIYHGMGIELINPSKEYVSNISRLLSNKVIENKESFQLFPFVNKQFFTSFVRNFLC